MVLPHNSLPHQHKQDTANATAPSIYKFFVPATTNVRTSIHTNRTRTTRSGKTARHKSALARQAARAAAPTVASLTCSVQVRPTNAAPTDYLHLAEVQLYNSNGAIIDRTLLNFQLSSTMSWKGVLMQAGNCNDGSTSSNLFMNGVPNKGTGQICHSNDGDKSPMLKITYPCSSGLSKVVVHNRGDCCRDRIDAFTLDALVGTAVVKSYILAPTRDVYSVDVPVGELASDWHACLCIA